MVTGDRSRRRRSRPFESSIRTGPPDLLNELIDALSGDTPDFGDFARQHLLLQTRLNGLTAEPVPGNVDAIKCLLGRSAHRAGRRRTEDVDSIFTCPEPIDCVLQDSVAFDQCVTGGPTGIEQLVDRFDDSEINARYR